MKFVQIASAVGLSTVKHTLGGVPLAAGFGFSYLETVGYTALGGIIGAGVIVLFAQFLQKRSKARTSDKPKRRFTRKNRLIIRVKNSFGLGGIAFLTPALLSIPIGTMICCGMYPNKKKVFLYQCLSVVFWSFLGAGLAQPIAQLFY